MSFIERVIASFIGILLADLIIEVFKRLRQKPRHLKD